MNPEAEHIRKAIRRHAIRRNTRELWLLLIGIYVLCGAVAWVVFA
jgi:hypothetical protein